MRRLGFHHNKLTCLWGDELWCPLLYCPSGGPLTRTRLGLLTKSCNCAALICAPARVFEVNFLLTRQHSTYSHWPIRFVQTACNIWVGGAYACVKYSGTPQRGRDWLGWQDVLAGWSSDFCVGLTVLFRMQRRGRGDHAETSGDSPVEW